MPEKKDHTLPLLLKKISSEKFLKNKYADIQPRIS
jgi:hypothetical protein